VSNPSLPAKTAYKVCEQWLTTFWNDCCGIHIAQIGELLTLPNSSWEKGGGPMKKLYIRSCYTTIMAEIVKESKTHVLVRGTPGIGKSAFLFYYIYYVAQMNGDNVSICLTYLHNEAKCTAYLLRVNGVATVSATYVGVPDYHFSDSVDISTAGSSTKLTILFASIDEAHFKEFVKAKSSVVGAWDIYMPLVKFEELENMVPNQSDYDMESLQFRHDIMGGSARNCLDVGNYSEPNEETSSNISEALKLFFPHIDEAAQRWAVNTLGLHIETLLSSEGAEHLKRSVFQHVYVDCTNFRKTSQSFCSNFMKYLCGRILKTKTETIQQRITKLFGDCGAGVVFEAMAFDTILNNLQDKKEYTMRNLDNTKKTAILKLPDGNSELTKVLIRKIEDIKQLKNGDIGVPVVGNFPLIDFVIKKPPTFLQMTISTKHSGAETKLTAIQKALGGQTKSHKMVFVTPHTNVMIFSRCKNMNIKQFVMCDDLTASSDVLGGPPRKKSKGSHSGN
jgi:hypothetical protein